MVLQWAAHWAPNIFMGHVERLLATDIDSSCLFYCRYMDDTCVAFRNEKEASKLLSLFNSVHRSLCFTSEFESNGTMSFLDLMIHRRPDGTFAFSIFRKKTWTGVYTSFHSFVPISYKRALVKSLFTRVVRLCSAEFLADELDFVRNSLLRNAYPDHFIDKHKVTVSLPKVVEHTVPRKPVYLQVPFYGDKPAHYFRDSILRLCRTYFPAAHPFVFFRTTPIPARSPKDRLPVSCSSSIIYKFSCDCGAVYYGRTNRRLEVRIREHVPKWLLDGKHGRTCTAITSHALACSSICGRLRDKFSVVFRARNERTLRIFEALAIRAFKPDLCKQKDLLIDLKLPW
jgi:hypothetical protein